MCQVSRATAGSTGTPRCGRDPAQPTIPWLRIHASARFRARAPGSCSAPEADRVFGAPPTYNLPVGMPNQETRDLISIDDLSTEEIAERESGLVTTTT